MTVEFIAQGRIVWGHPANAQKKTDQETGQTVLDDQGQPVLQWVFGLAIPKDEWNANVWPHIYNEALTAFPSGNFPQKFSWKYKDGDTDVDQKGNLYSGYEGRAGCMILTVSTELKAPPIYKMENGAYVQMEGNQVKCGDYVAVKTNCKFNGATGLKTPGVYINPEGIVHVGYGSEIHTGGFDVDEAFAGFNAALPVGASATPIMSAGGAPMPAAMQPAAAPVAPVPAAAPVAPVPAAAPVAPVPAAAPVAPVPAPAHDYVAQATGQQPPTPPAMQPAAAPVPGVPAAPTAVPGQPPAMPGVPPTGLA